MITHFLWDHQERACILPKKRLRRIECPAGSHDFDWIGGEMTFPPAPRSRPVRGRLMTAILMIAAAAPLIWAQSPKRSVISPSFDVASVKAATTADFQEDR